MARKQETHKQKNKKTRKRIKNLLRIGEYEQVEHESNVPKKEVGKNSV